MRLASPAIAIACVAGAAASAPARAAGRVVPRRHREIANDARYAGRRGGARFAGQPWGRPCDGARVAVEESDFASAAAGVKLELRRQAAESAEGLLEAIQRLQGTGTRFFLLDAPGEVVATVAQRTR